MALDLAYSAGTLTVTGGTSGSPYTWEDVWDYDDSGGGGTNGTGEVDGTVINTIMDKCTDGLYTISCDVEFGDGSTTTYFKSAFETVRFDDGKVFEIFDNANLQLGEKGGSSAVDYHGRQGSKWSLAPSAASDLISSTEDDVVCNMYASVLEIRSSNAVWLRNGTVEMRDCIVSGNQSVVGGAVYLAFNDNVDYSLYRCQFTDVYMLGAYTTPSAFENVTVSGALYAIYTNTDVTADSPVLLDNTNQARQNGTGKTLNIVNPNINLTAAKLHNNTATSVIKEQYTCNIRVIDESGDNVEGATVTCTDKDDNEVFSVTTAADGTITEQTITYKQWVGTDEAAGETEYSPHCLAITYRDKTYYGTAIAVDSKIDWTLSLNSPSGGTGSPKWSW